jgi:hypothetical protein
MQTPKQQQKPGTRTTGEPSDNDTDVNQQDHISSQTENENLTDSEEDDDDTSDKEEDATQRFDEQDPEENNITDEDEGHASHF